MPVRHDTPSVNPSAQFLYRLKASDGTLLYVGITTDWPARMKQHQADKPWWSEVLGVELVRLDCTRPQVEAIEKAVIKAEQPRYNVVHNGEARRTMTVPNPFRDRRYGKEKAMTREERQEIIERYSAFGGEWHESSAVGYGIGWTVEHPEFGRGVVVHHDDDLVHGDVRVKFDDDHMPYRCLSVHWAPFKVVSQ
jgi:predicted GIY-YIG superfamily endonuclease